MSTRPSQEPLALLSGVDALVRLLILRAELDERRGLRTGTMVSGYPGSPLGTLDLALERAADELAAKQVHHQPGVNEELAVATVWGSQMGTVISYSEVDGVAGVWYGKTPGLDRSGDALKHGNAMGAGPNGGVVVVCGDDPTAKSSTLPCDSQHSFEDACIPVLYPGDQQEVVDLGAHAFYLSRFAGCWVGLKIITTVADGIGTVDLATDRLDPSEPHDLVIDGIAWQHQPERTIGPHHVANQEQLVVEDRLRAAQGYVRHNGLDRSLGTEGARLGIVCAGKTYYDLIQALSDLGVELESLESAGLRILKLAMTYPLVPETLVEFAGTVSELVVIEEKRPFIETQLRSILHEAGSRTPVHGKRHHDGQPLCPSVGELDASAVGKILTRVAHWLRPERAVNPARRIIPLSGIPNRSPGFCSGCPHNRSTVFPDGALVGGGVGCHGIMYFEARHLGMRSMPPTPMGAEGVPWIGLSPFVDEPHLIQNLGDGTLSHSGTLAIRASVAAGSNVTFKILYNAAVAMTGGQDVAGLMDVPSMTRALAAEGVAKLVVVAEDPKHYGRRARWAPGTKVLGRGELESVQERLRRVEGVTVIIYDQRCAAEARRLRKRGLLEEPPQRVVINEAVCEGCGDCSTKSNCLSVLPVETELGVKRQIHDLSCNRDYTCLEGDCPSFVTLAPKSGSRRRSAGRASSKAARAPLPEGSLPLPTPRIVERQYGIFFTGIGGTGVVTANRIIAAAAESAGLLIRGMDQTGLSQKAGAVTSHLHLAVDEAALGAASISEEGADLYLSGDILQAASERNLSKVRPGRTVAVVDRDLTPTASMLQTGGAAPELESLEAAISEQVGDGRVAFLDSTRIAERLLANSMLANVVLLGAAFQLGSLPVSLSDIDRAMERQGGAAADNRAAFTWGRWAVHEPESVAARLAKTEQHRDPGNILDPSPGALDAVGALVDRRSLPEALHPLVLRRSAQLIDYQNTTLAERFLDLVERVAAVDNEAQGWALTAAAAESWFKLLSYKDEYEVARLHLKVDYDRVADELGIDGAYSVTYHLHPPTLRRLGRRSKLPMGTTYRASFHLLRKMRKLRGTPFDLFGWDRERRMERELIEDYEQLVAELLGSLASLDYEEKLRLAASAMSIKGYGPIKVAAAERWRAELAESLQSSPTTGSTGA